MALLSAFMPTIISYAYFDFNINLEGASAHKTLYSHWESADAPHSNRKKITLQTPKNVYTTRRKKMARHDQTACYPERKKG